MPLVYVINWEKAVSCWRLANEHLEYHKLATISSFSPQNTKNTTNQPIFHIFLVLWLSTKKLQLFTLYLFHNIFLHAYSGEKDTHETVKKQNVEMREKAWSDNITVSGFSYGLGPTTSNISFLIIRMLVV